MSNKIWTLDFQRPLLILSISSKEDKQAIDQRFTDDIRFIGRKKMDYFKELWILIAIGAVGVILFLFYVIRVERKIVKIISKEERRIKKEKEAMEKAKKRWEKKE